MQPGMRMPSGVFQPGAQPGAQPGLVQPGMMQAGVFQPGAQPGLVQPCLWPQGGVFFAPGGPVQQLGDSAGAQQGAGMCQVDFMHDKAFCF